MDSSLLKATHPELNIDWIDCIESTQSAVQPNSLLIAETQTAGVGRRGNRWLTVKNKSICLSLRLSLPTPVSGLSGYALAIAVAVIETLLHFSPTTEAQLKWPNDLYVKNKKFGGILINLTPKNKLTTDVTIGIGINWSLSAEQLNSIDQPVSNIPLDKKPSRVTFINQLVAQIKANNQLFLQTGLHATLPIWQKHDYLANKNIVIKQDNQNQTGQYMGIDAKGQLLAKINDQLKTFAAAEVSVRDMGRNHV